MYNSDIKYTKIVIITTIINLLCLGILISAVDNKIDVLIL
jgi:hypothetical protein